MYYAFWSEFHVLSCFLDLKSCFLLMTDENPDIHTHYYYYTSHLGNRSVLFVFALKYSISVDFFQPDLSDFQINIPSSHRRLSQMGLFN